MHRLSVWTFRFVTIGCIAVAITAGCGGGGGGGGAASPASFADSGHAFSPNYLQDLKSLSHWSQFPVNVYFDTSGSYTPVLQASATTGFDNWEAATGNVAAYHVVTDPSQAQITIQFVPTLPNSYIGWTTWSYDDNGVNVSATTRIAVTGLGATDVQWVGCHEMGHAMGLNGHSKDEADVMFATHLLGSTWALTPSDVDTVKSDYYWLFTSASPAVTVPPGQATHSAEIYCQRQ